MRLKDMVNKIKFISFFILTFLCLKSIYGLHAHEIGKFEKYEKKSMVPQ